LSPDGRLSFTPKNQEWQPLMDEVVELLHAIGEISAAEGVRVASADRAEQLK
jgi:hypothetical protein